MATSGGMLMVSDGKRPPRSGGIFTLSDPAPENNSLDVGDGWVVELRSGSRDILARGGDLTSYDECLPIALSYAQRGLDLLSAQGIADLNIRQAEDLHNIWWLTVDGVVLRIVYIRTTFNLDVPPATLIVKDQFGNIVPQPPVVVSWHPSYRYFRLSQLTDDLFDAFRNLYLALESILDTLSPIQTKPRESDVAWIKRVLSTMLGSVDFASCAPPGTGTAIDRIVNEIYGANRTALFHARGSRTTLFPGELSDRSTVDSARSRLARLYLLLMAETYHLRRQSGGVFTLGFHRFAAGGLDTEEGRLIFHLSGEAQPFLDGQNILSTGRSMVTIPTRREPTLDGPFVKMFVGESLVSDLAELSCFRQLVATTRENEPIIGLIFDEDMTFTHLYRVEMHLGLRARNVREIKRLYAT